MTVVHQPSTTFSPGIFIVSFLLNGITVLWYSFPEEDYFSISNFANGPFLAKVWKLAMQWSRVVFQSLQTAKKNKLSALAFLSLHIYCWLCMWALSCTHLRISFLQWNTKPRETGLVLGSHNKFETWPNFVWRFAKVLKSFVWMWALLGVSLSRFMVSQSEMGSVKPVFWAVYRFVLG